MLKKLMKYDIKWINKVVAIFFFITLFLAILTRISSCFTSSFIGEVVYFILKNTFIATFISCIFNLFIRYWVRFRNNNYKDESYLTHTLPITKNQLYDSKVLSGVSLILIYGILLLGFLAIVFLDNNLINVIKEMFHTDYFRYIILFIIVLLLELIYMLLCGTLGIVIGFRSNNHKDLKAILTGLGVYFLFQCLLLAFIYIVGLFNSDVGVLFESMNTVTIANISSRSMNALIYISILAYVVADTSIYLIGKKIFNKGVNVD